MRLLALRHFALVAAALVSSAGPACATETVKMGDLPTISNAGLYIAMEKGFFAERGLTVDTERFASGGKMTAPLSTGQIDVAVGSPSAGLFNAIASGMEFKIVADKGQARPGYSFLPLIVRKDLVDSGRVRSIKDLKGMKIATGAKGINGDYLAAKMLEHDGVPFGAVEMVYLPYPDAIKAFANRAVDAAIAPEPWGVQAEQLKVGVRLFLTEQVPALATFQVAVVMYGTKFIKERRPVAREFMRAYLQGVRYYNERGLRDLEIATIISKYTGVPVRTIQAAIPFYIDSSGHPRVQDLAAMQDFFYEMGWVKAKVPMERVVDLSFLD